MLKTAHELGGRGYAIAVWTVGLMTIVMLMSLWLLKDGVGIQGYMMSCGAIGAAYQGQNIARALPGKRLNGSKDERI